MSDPGGFPTLQSIVLHEVQNNVALVRNSATEALLWLRRGLKFLKEFLSEVNAGHRDIQGALSKHDDTGTSANICAWTLTVLRVSPSRQCVWKDPAAVPRLGRARSVCCRYLPTSHQHFCPPTLWIISPPHPRWCFPSWRWEQLHPIRASAPPWCRERATSWRAASPEGCTGIWGCTCPPWRSSWPSWMTCTKSTTWSLTKWCEYASRKVEADGGGSEQQLDAAGCCQMP